MRNSVETAGVASRVDRVLHGKPRGRSARGAPRHTWGSRQGPRQDCARTHARTPQGTLGRTPCSKHRGRHDDQAARNGGGNESLMLQGEPGTSEARRSRLGPHRRVPSSIHPSTDYEKMVGRARHKLTEAGPESPQSARAAPSKRRRRATGAGEPEMELEPPAQMEKSGPPGQSFLMGGRNLPGGARDFSPRRIRSLNAQNCLQLEAVARSLLVGRFQFLHCILEQLREKMQGLQVHRFSSKTTLGIGEPRGGPNPLCHRGWGRAGSSQDDIQSLACRNSQF